MPMLSPTPSLTLSPASTTSDNLNHRPFAGRLLSHRSANVTLEVMIKKKRPFQLAALKSGFFSGGTMEYYRYYCDECHITFKQQTLKGHKKALQEVSLLEKLMGAGEEIECPNCGNPVQAERAATWDTAIMHEEQDKGVGKFD